MPELPEVETVCRGLAPALCGRTVEKVCIWRATLREPLPRQFKKHLLHRKIISVWRRAKYIVITTDTGSWLVHLGMSGVVHIGHDLKRAKHTHIGVQFNNGLWMHYEDPRRFGRMDFTHNDPAEHAWLCALGPEPLTKDFSARYLQTALAGKSVAIKIALMDAQVVAGVGNIYASEILFRAGVRPQTSASQLQVEQLRGIVQATKYILKKAIRHGGSTIKDFVDGSGKPGYFQTQWQVYNRTQCRRCHTSIRTIKQSGRATHYCPHCQK